MKSNFWVCIVSIAVAALHSTLSHAGDAPDFTGSSIQFTPSAPSTTKPGGNPVQKGAATKEDTTSDDPRYKELVKAGISPISDAKFTTPDGTVYSQLELDQVAGKVYLINPNDKLRKIEVSGFGRAKLVFTWVARETQSTTQAAASPATTTFGAEDPKPSKADEAAATSPTESAVALRIVSAGNLGAPMKDAFVERKWIQREENATVVHAVITNAGVADHVVDRKTILRIAATIEGVTAPKSTEVIGLFVNPFRVGEKTTIQTGGKWVSWYNLGDSEHPSMGTHVYLPLDVAQVTIPPKAQFDFWVVLPSTGKETSFSMSVGSLKAAVLAKTEIGTADEWTKTLQKDFGTIGGAKNFVPRTAPADAVTVDGLPILTVAGIKWRAGMESTGPGLVYFRRIGSDSMPFGGASEYATEMKLSE